MGDVALHPIPDFFKTKLVGIILAYFGPHFIYHWYGSTGLEKILLTTLALLLVPPIMLIALDRGIIDVPRTDIDEQVREYLQRVTWFPSKRVPIRYATIRPTYYSGIHYIISPGTYRVDGTIEFQPGAHIKIEDGVTFDAAPDSEFRLRPESTIAIGARTTFLMGDGSRFRMDVGSKTTIAAGAEFAMGSEAYIEVRGNLQAQGTSSEPVVFRSKASDTRWGNITFWGEGANGSVLQHCVIRRGSGYRISASDAGYFDKSEKIGYKVGGGLLIYHSVVYVSHSQIMDCEARFGGGAYLRSEAQKPIAGSSFDFVTFEGCRAIDKDHKDLAGGGATLIKNVYAAFSDSHFLKNQSLGHSSCGGAVFVGVDGRANFDRCYFEDNKADAEGGAIFAYFVRETEKDNTSGVMISGGEFVNNQAKGTGGAIAGYNSRLSIDHVAFRNNSVSQLEYKDGRVEASGGAVFLHYDSNYTHERDRNLSSLKLRSLRFFKNKAEPMIAKSDTARESKFLGGGLALLSAVRLKAQFYDLSFEANQAESGQHAAFDMKFPPEGWDEFRNLRFDARNPDEAKGAYYTSFQFVGKALNPPDIDASHSLPPHCYDNRPNDASIDSVVIHFISAVNILPDQPYDLKAILGIFTRESAPTEAEFTSAHYLIDRSGKVYCLVEEARRAWHAGKSQMPDGRENVNDFSVGVEMVRLATDVPTEPQYEALTRLIYDIKRRNPKLQVQNVVGHDTVRLLWNKAHRDQQAALKEDPGPLFLWPLIISDLERAGF